ncbi:MAG: thiamine-phosphate kinase [Planctomycetes bacterium]|nr:thiamine-phosphate kinase [Planctomycetota bacterium]
MTGEFAYISWVRQQTAGDARVPIGIGDDAAAVRLTSGRDALITTDMILEGVHFDLSRTTPRMVGRKAMAVNLSDIAAMAAVPVAAVVSVGLPGDLPQQSAEELYHGIRGLADEFSVALVGGDTNLSRSGLVVSITLVGETTQRGPVRRCDARPEDWILATGSFGGSIVGKHLEFTPRVREALALHERYDLHAMIDVSDGLAADLGHILEESNCGAVLRASKIPISDAARQMPGPVSPLDRALHDGEDFELLCTLAADDARRLLTEQPLGVPVSHIGFITAGRELVLEADDGSRRKLEPMGYDHFRQ